MSGPHVIKVLNCPDPIPKAEDQPWTPIPKPHVNAQTVKIAILQAGVLRMMSTFFCDGRDLEPEFWGNIPDFCFIIERTDNEGTKQRVLFDLGLRKEGRHNGSDHLKYWTNGGCSSSRGCGEALDRAGISRESINHIVVSHTHFDHVGDLREFPSTTRLVVGPDSPVGEMLAKELDVELEVVECRQTWFTDYEKDQWVDIASFKGLDFWGDGSLYIIDLPGHKAGHIGLLARTSSDPPVYHCMAADSCHTDLFFHPDKVKPRIAVFPVPGAPSGTFSSLFDDIPTSYISLAKLQRASQEPDIGIWTAHGNGLLQAFASQGLEDGEIRWMKGDLTELRALKAFQTEAS